MYLRLRQICLVAKDLEASVRELRELFGLEVCYRDPNVAKHGLVNAVLPVGTNFLEIVAPSRADTAGGRHLARRGGDGGYMVILNCESIDDWRKRLDAKGVRIVHAPTYPEYRGLHLHPKDTGGALLELNHHVGGESPTGPYHPAGAAWQKSMRMNVLTAMTAAELQSDDPVALASRWGDILDRAPGLDAHGNPEIHLDEGRLRFVRASDGRGEGLGGIDVRAADPIGLAAAAAARGVAVRDGVLEVCGIRVRFDRLGN
jgi:catechol 2,3-dioxygenase-like lactoylglutathione lyase family enzyme